ncbi:unnamed protein product [Paramecium sonneborni]|uniref:Transmembrane protein n=1 Tax=Paramecium sonneborni TaxID=65129 RepID=A0A8S1RJW5_9CILI|nr:unnamed protein product [Paramecium sonneborni]
MFNIFIVYFCINIQQLTDLQIFINFPQKRLQLINNKENIAYNSSKLLQSKQNNYQPNNLTTYFQIRTPTQDRKLSKFEDNNIFNHQQPYLNTKENLQQSNNKLHNNTNQQLISQKNRRQLNFLLFINIIFFKYLLVMIKSILQNQALVKVAMLLLKCELFKSLIKQPSKCMISHQSKVKDLIILSKKLILSNDQITKLYHFEHYISYINLVIDYYDTDSLHQLFKSTCIKTLSKKFAFKIIHQ